MPRARLRTSELVEHAPSTSPAGDALSITFQPLSEADPAGVRDLLVGTVWKRDWSEELAETYFSWRYRARESGDTLVASDQGRCIGILDSFTRPYWIAGRQQIVRETCDWFCLPEYRAFGVGLHLMRRMMAKPEPILVIGGTDLHPQPAAAPEMGAASRRRQLSASPSRPEPWPGLLRTSDGEAASSLRAPFPTFPCSAGSRSDRRRRQTATCACACSAMRRRSMPKSRRMRLRPRSARECSTGLRAHPRCSVNSSS